MTRPSLGRLLGFAFGAVAVGAVVLTALLIFGLARLGAPQRAIAQLRAEAQSSAELAGGLACDAGQRPARAISRELGPRTFFVPDNAPPRLQRAEFADVEGRAQSGGRAAYYSSAPATVCGRPGRLYVMRPAAEVPTLPEGFGSRLGLAALVALAVSILVASLLASRLGRPLRELAAGVRAFAKRGEKPAAPAAGDPAEVAELKDAFGGMVDDLGAAREREKAFLLSVSHELRTPLTAIRGYGEALSDGTASRPKEAGEVVVRESQRLERLVQDLLDLGRLESGEFSVRPSEVELGRVASDVQRSLQPFAKANGLGLKVTGPRRSGAEARDGSVVHTDPDRLHQMVSNLVENALRVSPPGTSVVIDVGDGAIAVADSGPGLDADAIAHAFERFYLWRRYKGERPVGSGLGLAIVGELSRRLGVHVDVRSDERGSRFEISFPS